MKRDRSARGHSHAPNAPVVSLDAYR
jgi:hypothetical protein